MSKIKVGVLRGGISLEHKVSMKSGKTIINNLNKEKYEVFDIIVSINGDWTINEENTKPEYLNSKIDIIFSVLHGHWGEDGQAQKILEKNNIPFIGSDSESSKNSFDKIKTKKIIENNGIKTPKYIILESNQNDYKNKSEELLKNFPNGCVVKANNEGSSFGVFVCKDVLQIEEALKKVFNITNIVFVEEFIKGREFTCGVFDGPKGLEELPIVEIIPNESQEFFDYDAKYNGKVQEVCPAIIEDENLVGKIKDISLQVHKVMGLSDFSRTDFMYNENGELFVLEVNTLPGMTETSLLPQELRAQGYSLKNFLDFVISKKIK